ncbi:MAG: hypothetical protein Q4D56_09580, partial [Bacteroides sp.]|nr:hypothetical protein [Bacteroides sp.]
RRAFMPTILVLLLLRDRQTRRKDMLFSENEQFYLFLFLSFVLLFLDSGHFPPNIPFLKLLKATGLYILSIS